jgi:hypothetical protein
MCHSSDTEMPHLFDMYNASTTAWTRYCLVVGLGRSLPTRSLDVDTCPVLRAIVYPWSGDVTAHGHLPAVRSWSVVCACVKRPSPRRPATPGCAGVAPLARAVGALLQALQPAPFINLFGCRPARCRPTLVSHVVHVGSCDWLHVRGTRATAFGRSPEKESSHCATLGSCVNTRINIRDRPRLYQQRAYWAGRSTGVCHVTFPARVSQIRHRNSPATASCLTGH